MSSAMYAYGEKIFHYTQDYFTNYLFYFTYVDCICIRIRQPGGRGGGIKLVNQGILGQKTGTLGGFHLFFDFFLIKIEHIKKL